MADLHVVMVTLDCRDQFDRILEGQSAAKATAICYAHVTMALQNKGDLG